MNFILYETKQFTPYKVKFCTKKKVISESNAFITPTVVHEVDFTVLAN